ncbi:MAG: prolyl oligopeptidase family serine peptidase [Planctomycetota bacterium]
MRTTLAALIIGLVTTFAMTGQAQETESPETPAAAETAPAEAQADDPAPADAAEATVEKTEAPQLQTAATASDDQAEPPAQPSRIELREFLVLPRVGSYGGRALHVDPIDHAIATGGWKAPAEGDTVVGADGKTVEWTAATADADGRLSGPAASGGYAYTTVTSPQLRVMLLEASRHAAVRMNGRWLAGDPYGYGGPHLPVLLESGDNNFLFHLAQPGFQASLKAVEEGVTISTADATLPDVLTTGAGKLWAAMPVVNTTSNALTGGEIRVTIGQTEQATPLTRIEPLAVYKAPFRLPEIGEGEGSVAAKVAIYLPRADTGSLSPDPAATIEIELNRVTPADTRTETFVSRVDGSVQPFSVVPASEAGDAKETGLILALHGLATDHKDFAKNFEPKAWAHVVVPQNRRPFGFDWEDWGATDAMEALAYARKRLTHNPRRTYVTGHGMGGHGAWRLAMRYPDQFAATGPSAGWIDHKGAGEASDNPAANILSRGADAAATAPMLRNLSTVGVYLLHGEKDQRVPPAQSRYMRGRLGEFHPDFVYHERAGAGHWWGPEGVDWPPMMQFFKQRQLPRTADVLKIDFSIANLAEGAQCHWAKVEAQEQPLASSRIVIEYDKDRKAFVGRTENVARLLLDLKEVAPSGNQTIRLDGTKTLAAKPGRSRKVWLEKDDRGQWKLGGAPPRTAKTARRAGLLKSVFSGRPLLVYGTGGSAEEKAWAEAKAHFDAQSFWRRGNGSFEVIPDTAFDASAEPNRNVVLYGNAKTNKAWPRLLTTSPVQVRGDRVDVSFKSDSRPEFGSDLAVLMVRPRPGSTSASVAVVGGTGIDGMRLTNRMRYFVSGVTYPDFLVFGPEVLKGEGGDVRAAGFFGDDWSVGAGEIEWRDIAL